MAIEGKDRLGNKIQDAEAARENQWARQHDEELLEKMRKRLDHIACPHCKQFLVAKTEDGVHMMVCPKGDGAWLDASALKAALKRQK
jgi:hypothetical protein